ncbi:MAG: peptide chain release factor aRF-1 [Candidatus Aenigmarchaeota archaeon]|nr:peptide chain release factor aRF-1 [Candidatus Aenigmarchaeota archaeon]
MLKELEKYRGRHTELVSFYLPAGYNLQDAINQIVQEISTAQNIKLKSTRKNVVAALEKIVQQLKLIKQLPENGLAVFCGNVSEIEGRQDIRIWLIEPPEKLNVKLYWCDQKFILDPLKDMIKDKDVYGLIVLDAGHATIGLLKGKRTEVIKDFDSNVPGKTSKGGWSQQRYKRIREQALNDYLKRVAEIAGKQFSKTENLKGIIIGGPGPVKDMFYSGDYLPYDLKEKVLGIKDTGYTGEYGLEELVKRSDDLLREAEILKEKKVLQKFFEAVYKGENVVYGYKDTIKALEMGAVDKLIISEDFDFGKFELYCSNCGYEEVVEQYEHKLPKKCPKCGGNLFVEKLEDYTEKIVEMAKQFGTDVVFVSDETPEGKQFYSMGGIGGFLRFKVYE